MRLRDTRSGTTDDRPRRGAPRRRAAVAVALGVLTSLGVPALGHEERVATFPSSGDGVPDHRQDGPYVVVCKPDSLERAAALAGPLRTWNDALWQDCQRDGFAHIQAAVDWVAAEGAPGYRILVMPGVYREEPSLAAAAALADKEVTIDGETTTCQQVLEDATSSDFHVGGPLVPGEDTGSNSRGTAVLTYEEQAACPHIHNLILVAGDDVVDDDVIECNNNLCDLQIEGTGGRPEDVTIDGDFRMLNGIRADRADGFYLKNVTVQRFEFNAIYVMETDGFVLDDTLARWNDEYAYLSFAADHGVYENCEGYGNGDSVVYPGSAAELYDAYGPDEDENGLIDNIPDWRPATEIRACRGHHSTLGYSGTAGNGVYAHHNEFDHNAGGGAMDSLFPDHPGMPQDHAWFADNLWHENNLNYFEEYVRAQQCDDGIPFGERGTGFQSGYDDGVVCPVVPQPVGTGTIVAGGNYNLFEDNTYYDNWRQGTFQIWVPEYLRRAGADEPTSDLDGQTEVDPLTPAETSHWNTYRNNRLDENPAGPVQPNGVDFTWDQQGEANCWIGNTSPQDVTWAGVDTAGAPVGPTPTNPAACDDPTVRNDAAPEAQIRVASTNVVEGPCADYDRDTYGDPGDPATLGCDWFDDAPVPDDRHPGAPTLERLDGDDRIHTAVLAAQEAFPGHAPVVVMARADLYPDALVGAPLARALGGPMLLTYGGGLDPRVVDEIDRLGAHRVVVLGGTGAIPGGIVAELESHGLEVTRVSGPTRFETATEVARLVGGGNGFVAKGVDPDPSRAWADVLAISSTAALLERPILLTAGDHLPAATRAFLESGQITDVHLIGGTAAISGDVADEIASLGPVNQVLRLAGATRYLTSLEIARYALANIADPTELWLATGGAWPDGIAGGPAVAADEGVLLLVPGHLGPVRTWLDEVAPFSTESSSDTRIHDVLERIRVLGGDAAVPDAVTSALRTDYGAVDGDAVGDRTGGTRVTGGVFAPLPTATGDYQDVTGFAVMHRRLDGTTRTRVFVEGLPTAVGTMHPVHAHAEPCSFTPVDDNPHYQVDTAGPVAEPNEIHPMFRTGEGGVGVGDSTVMHIAGDDVPSGQDAVSVILHDPAGDKMLCADLR